MTVNKKGGTNRQNDQDNNTEQATHETEGTRATDSAKQTEATTKKVTPSIQQDLFENIHRLRVGSNFTEKSNPQKVLVTVPVRKPEPQEFFRVHPAEEYQFDTYTVEVKSKREHYLIEPRLIPYLPSDAKPKLIFTCINAQGVVFLYPLPLGQAERGNDYTKSAFTAVEMAKKTWVRMIANGIPLDTEVLADLKQYWEPIQERMVCQVDAQYGIFEGRHLNRDRFIDYLVREDIPWPRLPGQDKLALDDDTFKFMSRRYPQLVPLRDVLSMLSTMRLSELPVRRDGRNRCLLSAFQSQTGRNQPSNSKFIFGPSKWVRNLIKPQEGSALSYIDWSQQEVGIAAALS